jgi:hypothetical protein
MIKTEGTHQSSPMNNVLLTGIILLANSSVTDLVTYGIKAAIGGAVWLGYKVAADYIDRKRKNKE